MLQNVPIAIVGMGCFFPKAPSVKEFWRLILRGEDAISEVPDTHWLTEDYFDPDIKKSDHVYCKRGGFLPPIDFDPIEFGIPPSILEATDTSQLLTLVAAKRALMDAGYFAENSNGENSRVSVILGATGTQELALPLSARLGHPKWRKALEESGISPEKTDEIIQRISAKYVQWQENSFPGLLGNVIAGRICNRLNLSGTNCVVDAACASSMSAVHMAIMELATLRCDVAVTGGVDALNDIFMHMCFAKTQILSPTGDARPFSDSADGTVLGEGIGMLVLKRLQDAQKDSNRIYAVIKGIGTSSDGKSQSIYSPRHEGQVQALKKAYELAEVDPKTIELLEAHGTGTRVGDQVEFETLRKVFGNDVARKPYCALGSVKSNIGHTKAAAGSAGLIKAALSLYYKVLPPTLKIDRPDPNLNSQNSSFYFNNVARPWLKKNNPHPRRAGVSAFGFGGSNFHAVLEEYVPDRFETAWDGSVEIAAFSAPDDTLLTEQVDTFQKTVEKDSSPHIFSKHCAASRGDFSSKLPSRLLIVFENHQNVKEILKKARQYASDPSKDAGISDIGIFSGSGPLPGPTAFLFPGQGSQYPGMGRDLMCQFPQALAVLEEAETLFMRLTDSREIPSLCDIIYPHPVYSAKEKEAQEKTLKRTDLAQPAIGAVSLAMLEVLKHFGVTPDAAAGHSYGELPALCAAGRMDLHTCLSLSITRANLMGKLNGDGGSMLAVKAPLKTIEDILRSHDLDLVLANKNSAEQGVVSGDVSSIDAAESLFRQKGYPSCKLPVSAAFHSPLMESAHRRFKEVVLHSKFERGKIPVYANITGKRYPEKSRPAKETLFNQLISPVEFKTEIETLYRDGITTFIEIGPKSVLERLVSDILVDKTFHSLSIDESSGEKSGLIDLARTLCRLAALGYPVNLLNWEPFLENQRSPKMKIPLTGANIRTSKPLPIVARKNLAEERGDDSYKISKPKKPPASPKPSTDINFLKAANKKPVNDPMKYSSNKTNFIFNALKTVQEGLKSMQSLQAQTTETHKKFLETQAEATRTLQHMIASTQRLAETSFKISSPDQFQTDLQPNDLSADLHPSSHLDHTPAKPEVPDKKIADPRPSVSETLPESFLDDNERPKLTTTPAIDTDSNSFEADLITIVSELTGYPAETLTLEMDIESDLGIDSIKRVEILSALEERIDQFPSVAPEAMGTLKTLKDILNYLESRLQADDEKIDPVNESSPLGLDRQKISTPLLEVVGELTGYPLKMLDLDMDIESDLGIDSIKRVEILSALEEKLPGLAAVSPEIMGTLKTLDQIVDHISNQFTPALKIPETKQSCACTLQKSDSNPSNGEIQSDELDHSLISIISQLTGYPENMLHMDMDLEADLGIDSIKRVEILSAFEEKHPDFPPIKPEQIGRLKTLGQIYSHLKKYNSDQYKQIKKDCYDINSKPSLYIKEPRVCEDITKCIQRKIPQLVMTPRPSAPTVSLPEGRTLFVTDDGGQLSKALVNQYQKLGIYASLLKPTGQKPSSPAGGLILLPDRKTPGETYLMDALVLAQQFSKDLMESAQQGAAVFGAVLQMDGGFGFSGLNIKNPYDGGLSGLVKTASLEWPGVICHAIDVNPEWANVEGAAEAIALESLIANDVSPVEIGITEQNRKTVTLVTAAFPNSSTLRLNKNDVIVVTGGARGVTAASLSAIADRAHSTFILLGSSPVPEQEPDWLKECSDAISMKRAIVNSLFKGKQALPKEVEKVYRRYASAREIQSTINRLDDAGAKAFYYSVDLRNKDQAEQCIQNIRKKHGPVTALIHGAGILHDHLIIDKTTDEFNDVFSTKVSGFKNVMAPLEPEPLRYVILFSSVAGRFGNRGQVDYAMANEVLNKLAGKMSKARTDCQIVSINWGPWDGGMVNSALKKEFLKKGISLISPEAGAECLLREVMREPTDLVEVIIGAPLGTAEMTDNNKIITQNKAGENNGSKLCLSFKRVLDLEGFPILSAHRLNGTPVVPLAIMTEWISHGALHENPGLFLHGLEDMRVLKGIQIDNGKKMIRLMAGKAKKIGGNFEVDVEIRDGFKENKEVIHTRAKAILTPNLESAPEFNRKKFMNSNEYSRSLSDVYANILFHGIELQGIKRIISCDSKAIVAEVRSAPEPHQWMEAPLRSRWISDPLVLDSAFQMAIIWSYEQMGKLSLPSYLQSYRQFRTAFPKDDITAVFEIKESGNHKIRGDITLLDSQDKVVASVVGYEAVLSEKLVKAFRK